jgi:hypothetical protein
MRVTTSLAALLLCACVSTSVQPFTLDGPPLIQTSAFRAGVQDGRARFREIFRAVCAARGILPAGDPDAEQLLWRFAEEQAGTEAPVDLGPLPVPMRLIVIPGLLNDAVADRVTPFSVSRVELERIGLRSDLIVVSGRSSSEHNALQIRDALVGMKFEEGERVVMLGHSKGAVDLLVALVRHPEVRERVDVLLSVAGAIGGSPITDSISETAEKMFRKAPVPNSPPGDGGALASLDRTTRQLWLERNPLPERVRYFTIGAFAERDAISRAFQSFYDDVAVIDPRNDGQVLFFDQVIPAGTLLGFVRADHWAVALPFEEEWAAAAGTVANRNEFPRAALLEAALRYIAEKRAEKTAPPRR